MVLPDSGCPASEKIRPDCTRSAVKWLRRCVLSSSAKQNGNSAQAIGCFQMNGTESPFGYLQGFPVAQLGLRKVAGFFKLRGEFGKSARGLQFEGF